MWLKEVGLRPSPKHSLDRVDNNGDYAPGNMRWSPSAKDQNRKRRNSRVIEFQGRSMTVAEACEISGVPYSSRIWSRINRYGWDVERALSTPVKQEAGS